MTRTVCLMGPPGSGKTLMACLTAVRKPIHVLDVDRKIKSMSMLQDKLRSGGITVQEIGETIGEGTLLERSLALVKQEKPRVPQGWINFANIVSKLETNENAKKAGTIVIDSYTQLQPHLRTYIQDMTGKGKFVWDSWSVWGNVWSETTTILVDYALQSDKDLIITLHERASEMPSPDTRRVTKTNIGGVPNREYSGPLAVKIAGSIDGSFGLQFGTYFTDVYALRVDVERGKDPVWKCRVHPDGQRDLRCSVKVDQSEWAPDFDLIWNNRIPRQGGKEVPVSGNIRVGSTGSLQQNITAQKG